MQVIAVVKREDQVATAKIFGAEQVVRTEDYARTRRLSPRCGR